MTKTETVLAGAILLGGAGLGLVAGSVAFIRRHVTAEPAAVDAAARELDREAGRFVGQQPMREIRDGQAPLAHGFPEPSPYRGRSLHALISEVRSSRVVRVDIPLAVLRVAKRGGFRYLGELTPLLEDTEFETDRVDLSLDDIDRSALVVNHVHDSGARILVWVE